MTEVKMHKCQHNQKISKFCLSEHCQAKESGGCDNCIKKYHNHIGHTQFITEEEVSSIVKKYQTEQMYRPKFRPLQQSLYNYFSYMKNTLSNNFDIVCKSMINQTGYPYLHEAGILNCYKRLKNKQYRKVYQKQLKELYQNYMSTTKQNICQEECQKYMQAASRIAQIILQLQKKVKQISQIFNKLSTNNIQQYDSSYFFKANQILKDIQKYPTAKTKKSVPNTKTNQLKIQMLKKQEKNIDLNNGKILQIKQKQEKRKLNRQVSLDKKLTVESHFNKKAPSNEKPKDETPPDSKQLFQEIKQKLINNQARLKIYNTQKIQVPQKQLSDINKPIQPISQKKQSLNMSVSRESKSAKPKEVVQVKYTQKQTQINQKKQILMNLMNSKGTNKKLHTQGVQLSEQSGKIFIKNQKISPLKRPINMRNIQTSPPKVKYQSPERFLINKNFLTPSNPLNKASYYDDFNKKAKDQVAKRVKTSSQYEESSVSQQNKFTLNAGSAKNDTLPSSQQETNELFGAKSLIPFQDLKNDEQIQQKQESTQKRIIVPQITVNTDKANEIEECQSPMIKKMRQSDLFTGLKLTESKMFESVSRQTISKQESQKQSQEFKKQSSSQSSPMAMKKQQQNSIKLLLEALSLPVQKAIPLLQKSLQFSPNNLSAAQYLSYLYLDNNQPQQCLKLCNEFLKLISNPQNNELSKTININKSAALNNLGRYSECITFLQKCLRYVHNDILYKNLADAYYSIGILQKSIYNYEHSIIENRNNAQAHYNLAVCHYNQQNFHNASIYVDKAVKVDPHNKIYQQLKRYVEQKILNEVS